MVDYIKKKLSSLHTKMHSVKFGWYWSSVSGEVGFKISPIHYYLPLEKGVAFHLNILESHLPTDAFCKVWLKMIQCLWSKNFLKNFVNVISLFRYYLPLEKGRGPLNCFYSRVLCAKFGLDWRSDSGEEDF